jgi:hypothetical protein
MRSTLRAVVAAAFAAAALSSARGAPITNHFDELRTFMQAKLALILPNASENELLERAALEKGLAALNAHSASLDGDVRIYGRIAAAIDIPLLQPDDVQPLQNAIVALHGDAVPLRDALAARIDAIIAPKLLAAAQAKLADIDASLSSSVASGTTFVQGANDLHVALRAIAATNTKIDRGTAPRGSAARPGVGYFACLVDGQQYIPSFGSGRVKLDAGQPSEVTLTGYFPSAAKGGVEIQWSTGTFTGPGVYPLDGTSGAFVVLSSGGTVYYSDGSGGTVTVTSYDAATKRISGTFEASLVSDTDGPRSITNGSFDVRRYGTSGK